MSSAAPLRQNLWLFVFAFESLLLAGGTHQSTKTKDRGHCYYSWVGFTWLVVCSPVQLLLTEVFLFEACQLTS